MANRRQPWTSEHGRVVGLMVARAREAGIKWKTLEAIYGRDRTWLWRLAEEAQDGRKQQNSPGKQHHGACRDAVEPPILAFLNGHNFGSDDMGGGGGAPAPQVMAPPPPPTLSDPAVTNASRSEQQAAARARGRAATNLTGGTGLMLPAPTQQKVLLGQ